jgi:hypothetical protein
MHLFVSKPVALVLAGAFVAIVGILIGMAL